MRQITLLSGKGGTGKTSLTAAFASLAGRLVLADCDVDAADLHLICTPTIRERAPFGGGYELVLDSERCTGCGRCAEVCRFEAVRLGAADASGGRIPTFDPFACEACGCCVDCCPQGALKLVDATVGETLLSDTPYGPMVHARLEPGAENSGKLVAAVRQRAASIAEAEGIDLAEHFEIRAAALVNKADLSEELTGRIVSHCDERNVPVVGRLPFDRAFVDALVAGRNILEHPACGAQLAGQIRQAWETALAVLTGEQT